MAAVMSWRDVDDASSFTGTASSSSTVLGPGAITGRFLKAVGEKSLDFVVIMVIRVRLNAIERLLEKEPRVLRNPIGDKEWARLISVYTDLHELCRESRREYYPLSVRRAAANLIRDITLITRPSPEFFIDASPTNEKWEALLIRVHPQDTQAIKFKRRESISSYLVSSTNEKWEALLARMQRRESQGSSKRSSKRDSYFSHFELGELPNDENDLHDGVNVGVEYSPESADDTRNRRASFRDRLFKRRSSELPESPPPRQHDSTRKVLVLGTGEVGKSTLVKQIQATVQEFSQQDAEPYGDIIFNNIMDFMRSILFDVDTLDFSEDTHKSFKQVMAYIPRDWPPSPSLGDAIRTLWRDPAVRRSARRAKLGMLYEPWLESADYFVDSLDRIFAQDYEPIHEDIIRSRVRTTGIWENAFTIQNFPWLLIDTGGERSERKKWVNCSENATAIMFVVALSDYNKTLREDPEVNRMDESLALFKSIANSPEFAKTLIVVLFNKVDAFVDALEYSPLKDRYPDYTGEDSYDACQYFEHRFLSLIDDKMRPVVTKYICAISTEATTGTFRSIQDEINRHYEQNMDSL